MVAIYIKQFRPLKSGMGSLATYIVRRVLFAIPVFLAVSVLTFLITNAAGNPLEIVRIGARQMTAAELANLVSYFHLNEPLYLRYFLWLGGFLQGDMGVSLYSGTVSSHIIPWIGTTLELQLPSLFLALLIGIPIGVYSAKHQYSKRDYGITGFALFGISMPTFWLGIMLIIVFAYYVHWLPAFGAFNSIPPYWWGSAIADRFAHALLPTLVLTFVSLAVITRLMRANMLETLRTDYVLASRASGLSDWKVTYKHALKNAITPIVTIVGLTFGASLAGAPALETTFSWPGLGYEFVLAASTLDLPIVLGLTMIITIMVLIANLVTDIAYAYLDPRVRIS